MNHRVALYKGADEPILKKTKPYADRQVEKRNDDGMKQPIWSYGPLLSNSLVDFLDTDDGEDQEDDEEENENDFDTDYFS